MAEPTSTRLTTAERLLLIRKEARLTQPQLSTLTGIKQANISRYENGQSAPTAKTVDTIVAACEKHMGRSSRVLQAEDGVLGIAGRTDGKLVLVDPMAEPRPVEWLVEGFLARRFVTMIAGQEGAGKSSVTQTITVALTTGAPSVIGLRTPGQKLRGIVLDAENVMVLDETDVDGSLAQSRLQDYGLSQDDAHRVTIAGASGFDLDKDSKALEAVLDDMKAADKLPDFIVLDSFTSLWFGNENNVDDVRRVLTKLNRLAVKYNMGILLIHHTNKKGDAYRGTSAIGATIAAVFTFSRLVRKDEATGKKIQHETARFLAAYKVRMAAELKPRILNLTTSGVVDLSSVQPLASLDLATDALSNGWTLDDEEGEE